MRKYLLFLFILSAIIFSLLNFYGNHALSKPKNSHTSSDKIVLIGIDGATWKIMQPLIDEGRLPNIAKLINEGSSGVLSAQEPLNSAVIWTSIATGKNPEKHGITDFFRKKTGAYHLSFFDSSDRKTKAFWNILNDYGFSAGVVNWWLTWPSEEVNGYIVSDYFQPLKLYFNGFAALGEMINSGVKGVTYPESILGLLKRYREIKGVPEEFSYQGRKGLSFEEAQLFIRKTKSEKIDLAELKEKLLINRIKIPAVLQDMRVFLMGEYLLGRLPTDLFALYLEGTDYVQHALWEFYSPEECNLNPTKKEVVLFGRVIPDYYEWYDRLIGQLLDKVDREKTTVIIVSDHGFKGFYNPFPYMMRLNLIFEKLGWLSFKNNKVYWAKTTVYQPVAFSNSKLVCLNLRGREEKGIVDVEDYELFREKIKNELSALATEDGKKIFGNVKITENPKETNVDLEVKTNISISPQDKIIIKGEIFSLSKFMLPFTWSGTHDPLGIIIISGNHIKKGQVIKGATSYDITPTILALLGIPSGKDMDGKALVDALEEDFLKEKPPLFIDSHDSVLNTGKGKIEDSTFDEQMEERLKSIGYMQ